MLHHVVVISHVQLSAARVTGQRKKTKTAVSLLKTTSQKQSEEKTCE